MNHIQIPEQVIDELKCRNNIRQMLAKAQQSGSMLRPHFKTHQSAEVGQWFREEGIESIAVSSVTMANFFAQQGWKDIMIAFPVNLREIDNINKLAKQVRLGLLVSCEGVISLLGKSLSSPVDLYFKVDVGTHRTGFDPANIDLIENELSCLKSFDNINFRGFVAHAGHTYHAGSTQEIISIFNDGTKLLKNLREHFSTTFPGLIISWGDTPSCSLVSSFEGIDEIRPGNFVFYDLMQWKLGVCTLEQIAMVVAAPVVAVHPERNEAVVYAGAVHLSKEHLLLPDGRTCYGMMVMMDEAGNWEFPDKKVFVGRISQEHGIIMLPTEMKNSLSVGQLIGIVPVHSCLAADLLK